MTPERPVPTRGHAPAVAHQEGAAEVEVQGAVVVVVVVLGPAQHRTAKKYAMIGVWTWAPFAAVMAMVHTAM